MDVKEFLHFIKGVQGKLNMQDFLQKLTAALGIGAGLGIVLQGIAFFVPFYYANLYTGLVVLLAVLAAGVAAVLRRRTMEQAALAIDRFGFAERIITAYENLQKEGAGGSGSMAGDGPARNTVGADGARNMVLAQRQDAFRRLQAQKDKIHIRVMPAGKSAAGVLVLLAVMSVLAFVPSKMK